MVDLATDGERDKVRKGYLATELWRVSEAVRLDGFSLSRQFEEGGSAEKTAGKEWGTWVREKMEDVDRTGCRGLTKTDIGSIFQCLVAG